MGAQPQLSRAPIGPARTFDGKPVAFSGLISRRIDSLLACEAQLDVDRLLLSACDTSILKFRKAECVFAQGDPADWVFYVRFGSIKMNVVSNRGKEATIGMIGAGDFCGEGCLIDEPVRPVTAMTMSSSAVLRIQKRSFAKLLREHHEFSSVFTKFLVSRSVRIQKDLIDQRFHPSEYRLARLLMSLSDGPNQNFGQRIIPRISQETLASMVGTTRSRISFFLNKFKKAGMIEYSGGIRINPSLMDLLESQ